MVVKFADTQKDKEQRRLQQQLAQQMQQLNSASAWGSLTGLTGLTPQYLAVRGHTHSATPISTTVSYCLSPLTLQAPPTLLYSKTPRLLAFSFSLFLSFRQLPLAIVRTRYSQQWQDEGANWIRHKTW